MRKRSKLLSFTICLAMFLSTVCSLSTGRAESWNSSMSEEEYIINSIKQYVLSEGIDLKQSPLSISQAFEVINADNRTTKEVFLFVSGQCIGIMTFSNNSGDYTSSFIKCDLPQISACVEHGESIALMAFKETLLLLTQDGIQILLGKREFLASNDLSGIILEGIEKNTVKIKELLFDENEKSISTRSVSALLLVPFVSNAVSPDTGIGLCWAAALASIINYRCSDEGVNYTALGLYNLLKIAYPNATDYPVGSETWVQRAFSLASLTYTHVHIGATFPVVKTIIDDYRPIYCVLQYTNGAHSVVICGYSVDNGYYHYKLMDPNLSYYVSVSVSNLNAFNFTYSAPYGLTFNWWSCRYY